MSTQNAIDLLQDFAIIGLSVGMIFQSRTIQNLTKVQAIWDLIDAVEDDEP